MSSAQVKTELEHKHRLSRSLQRAVGDLIQLRQVQYTFLVSAVIFWCWY